MSNKFDITISAVDKTTEVVRKINAQVDKMMAPFDNLTKSVKTLGKEVGLNRLVQGLAKVERGAAAVAEKITSIVAPLAAVIGIGSVAGVAALAGSFGKATTELSNHAASIGISTQELQKWQGVAELAGLSAQDMTGSLASVGETLDNAFRTPETVRNMNAIGIEMHRLKNGSIDTVGALLDIAGAMEKQGNAETKKRIAEAFGVSALFPLLAKGRAAVEAFYKQANSTVKVFTPEQIEQGNRYAVQMQAVGQEVTGLKYALGAALLPAMERVVGAIDRMVAKYGDVIASKVAEYAERLANWIDRTDWGKVADDVAAFVDKLGGFKTIAITLAALTFAAPLAGLVGMVAQAAALSKLLLPLVANPLVIGIMGLTHTSDLNAGEQEELDRRRAGTPGYDAAGKPVGAAPAPSGAAAAPAAGATLNQKQNYLAQRLRADGFTTEQSAGIVGSLMQESGLDAKAVNAKSGATGISQWLGPRKKAFEQRYGHGLEKSTFEEQTDYMLWEMKNPEKRAGDLLRRAKTPEMAAKIHSLEYERPGADEANIAKRQINAAAVYAALSKQPAAPAATQVASTDKPAADAQPTVPPVAKAPWPAGPYGASKAGASATPSPQEASTTATQQATASDGMPGSNGTVAVTVRIEGAPKGTRTTVESTGNVMAQVGGSTMSKGQI